MPSDKAAYLAAHYLTSDSKPSSTKKRKRKQATSSSAGLLITDDDDTGWSGPKNGLDDDDDAPLTVAGTTNDFRRTKKSGWKTLGGGPISKPSTSTGGEAEAEAEAEAIIALAAAETAAAAAAEAAEDLQPSPNNNDEASTPQMSNGTLAGLQSASSLTAQLRKRQQQDAAELAALKAAAAAAAANNTQSDPNTPNAEPEIILRDATGRRVDASLRRAELRRAAAEAERAAQAKKDLQRGEVQRAEAAARRARLDEAALMPLARGKDDIEMNEEMKRAERWNDPMAEFLGGESGSGGGAAAASGGKGKGKGGGIGGGRRPVYKGGAAPNRYGIRPGYRWDGVDRGNGFEGERFKALNRRERNKGLEYAWQMDE